MTVNTILFTNFETLDVFGPIEVFGMLPGTQINYYSEFGGITENKDGIRILTQSMNEFKNGDSENILLIPGGQGTRTEIKNTAFIDKIKILADKCKYVLTVCTGSALLAETGLLNGLKATSNKRAFDWVVSCNDKVQWIKKARWVVDDKYYTSSGISAGTDMALGFISDYYGEEEAARIAARMEYIRNKDKNYDEFALD
jgi:putative intracellular protease/amidase